MTLINEVPKVRINYCFRETNKCANALARKRSSSSKDLMLFYSPFVDLCVLLFYDNSSLYYERLKPLNMFLSSSMLFDFYPKKKYKYLGVWDLLDYLIFNFSLFILCFRHKTWLFLENKRHNYVNFVLKKYMYTFYL